LWRRVAWTRTVPRNDGRGRATDITVRKYKYISTIRAASARRAGVAAREPEDNLHNARSAADVIAPRAEGSAIRVVAIGDGLIFASALLSIGLVRRKRRHVDARRFGWSGLARLAFGVRSAPDLRIRRDGCRLKLRRGGRVVEGARLESVYTGNRIVGSNPTPSASRCMQATV
jgi:hypothetical protein